MDDRRDNVTRLRDAYRRWDASKGTDIAMWTELFADDARLRSLAAGRPGLEFTLDCHSTQDVARYFRGLEQDWTMIEYKSEPFAVDGDRVVMRGRTSWRHRKTGRVIDTPKTDLITFQNGKIVECCEYYDTAMVLAAASA